MEPSAASCCLLSTAALHRIASCHNMDSHMPCTDCMSVVARSRHASQTAPVSTRHHHISVKVHSLLPLQAGHHGSPEHRTTSLPAGVPEAQHGSALTQHGSSGSLVVDALQARLRLQRAASRQNSGEQRKQH